MADNLEKSGFSLKKILFGKLSRRIVISFIILGICMALLGTFIFYDTSINSISKEVENHLQDTVQSRTNHIETYINQDTERIKLVTSRTQFRKDIESYLKSPTKELNVEIIKKLDDSKSSIEEIEEICFIGLNGKVVACSDGSFNGEDFGKEDFFINGLKMEGAYFFKHSHGYDFLVSAPISNSGNLMGVIITLESLDELSNIVHGRTGLGNTGEVLIAFKDKDGNIVYPVPRLFENSSSSSSSSSSSVPMKTALKGESIFFENALDYRDINVLAATRYIPSIGLGVVAKIDRAEVILPIQYKFLGISILIIVLVFIVFLIVGYFISRIITKPIRELTFATDRLRNKDFKARVNIHSGDEVEELGDSFNKTAEILENLDKEKNQIDKAKTEFLSITSHELRSPMTPMKAQLQMVLGDYFGKLNKEQKDSLQIVLNNTERLDKIIVDFLEISRIEAARLKFNFVRTDLNSTVNLVIDEMKNFMSEKKIRIENHSEKLPIIECDPDRVSQVLRNLINNAIKFTPENGKVEVSAKLHSGMILFSVKDSGIGIPEKDQRRLFEPFYQVDNMYQHKSGGTGLGLSICRGIVESQGGKIWLNSQPGRGTIFYFTLPLKPVRDIKAIKLLFSDSGRVDESIINLFKEYIGPLGEKEFQNLKESQGITSESINEYIEFLVHKGIMKKFLAEEFKNKVSVVLKGGKTKEVVKSDLESSEKKFLDAFETK